MAEVLVASVLGSVLLVGSAQSLKFSLQSAQVARSILTENDLKASIAQGLKEECATHLGPDKLTNTDTTKKNKGIGTVTAGLPGVKVGAFNDDIEVVKIELTGDPANTDRHLVVYYKKEGLGELNTIGGGVCSNTDQAGCFYHRCSVDYSGMFDPKAAPLVPKTDVTQQQCTLDTCHSISQEVLTEVEQKVSQTIANKACPDGQYLKGFNSNGQPQCEVASSASPLQKNCENEGAGYFVREIKSDGTVVCAPACSGGRQLFKQRTYELIFHTVKETVGIDEDFPQLPGGISVTSESRICQCPSDSNWSWDSEECVTCSSPQKWDFVEQNCITCSGRYAHWRLDYFEEANLTAYACRCSNGRKKKRMV